MYSHFREKKEFEERSLKWKKKMEERLLKWKKIMEERLLKRKKELEERQFKEKKEFEERLFKEKKEFEERLFKEKKEFEERLFETKKELDRLYMVKLQTTCNMIKKLCRNNNNNNRIAIPIDFIEIAIKAAQELLRINPSDINTLEYLIYFYLYNNNIDKVNFYGNEIIKVLKESIERNPFDPQLYCKSGIYYRVLNQYEKAIEQYEKAIEHLKLAITLDPGKYQFHFILAYIYFYGVKNIELAKKECIITLQLKSHSVTARNFYNKIISFEKKNNSKTKETQETQDIQETKKREKEPSFSEVMEVPPAKKQKTESESQLDSDKSKTRVSGSTEITVTSDTSSLSEKAVKVKLETHSSETQ